jgi:septum formation protein
MILDLLERLAALRVVLASSSPRRREVLASLGLAFDVVPSTFPEDLDKAMFTPTAYVAENALQKALEVFVRTAGADASAGASKPLLLISSDSVVVHEEHILEKPRDEGHARDALR